VDALVLAAIALWCFAVALAGGVVGLVLGNIRLPALLFAASAPAAGAGANIGVSGVAAAAAAVTHVRAGRVDWGLVAWMLPPSLAGVIVGSIVSGELPSRVLLIVIAVTLWYFGIELLRPRRSPPPKRGRDVPAVVASGVVIGFLGGVVGLILGALRLPALIRYGGEDVPRLIGSNLVVGVAVGLAGLAGHTPSGVDWTLFAVGAAASVPGAVLGARLTGRLPRERLLTIVGLILLVAGAATFVDAFL
jgi:uncharacterized membrane protein YfcA